MGVSLGHLVKVHLLVGEADEIAYPIWSPFGQSPWEDRLPQLIKAKWDTI